MEKAELTKILVDLEQDLDYLGWDGQYRTYIIRNEDDPIPELLVKSAQIYDHIMKLAGLTKNELWAIAVAAEYKVPRTLEDIRENVPGLYEHLVAGMPPGFPMMNEVWLLISAMGPVAKFPPEISQWVRTIAVVTNTNIETSVSRLKNTNEIRENRISLDALLSVVTEQASQQ